MDIEKDLLKVNEILNATDSMATADVCYMYIELYGLHVGQTPEVDHTHDNIDRAENHNIAGMMNRPSFVQEKYGKENNEN